jgi:hypothetical protein
VRNRLCFQRRGAENAEEAQRNAKTSDETTLAFGEGVAGGDVAGLQAAAEPGGPLCGASVGEGFGTDVAGCHALQAIIAYGRGGTKSGSYVRIIGDFALLGSVAPDARVAIGL